MKVIGFRKTEFDAPANGNMPAQHIKGYKVFCTFDDKGVDGSACVDFFISDYKAQGWIPTLGEEIELVYNKYGKIDRVEAA